MADQIDYQDIRKRVEKRLKKRQEFLIHLAVYVITNLGLWVMWLFLGGGFPWPVFATLGWGMGLAIHAITFFAESSIDQRREEMIDREIRREKMRLYGDPDYDDTPLSKPKRWASEPNLRLSDDGEITPEGEQQTSERATRKKDSIR